MTHTLRLSSSALSSFAKAVNMCRGALQPRQLGTVSVLKSRTFSTSLATFGPQKENSLDSPFAFLPNNALVAKKGRGERTKGLTEIRGSYYNPVTFTYLDELLSDWGGASKVTCFESSSPLIYCPQSLSMALRYGRRGLQVTDIDERSLLAVHSHSCLHRA